METVIRDRELEFLLYEFLDAEALLMRPRYADYSREAFDAVLRTARRMAQNVFASHNAVGDKTPPVLENGRVRLIPETGKAWHAFASAGFLCAHWDVEEGGSQLPETVLRAALSAFFSANVATSGYPFLTIGASNLLRTFGGEREKRLYLAAMGDGRFSGTMALTEPDQGSALGDIKTSAVIQPDGSYRIYGQKIFISGGEQDFTDNIVHMVLARISGAPPGAKGISLFLVPKRLVQDDGSLGHENDIALAGLFHKMGWRNTTSTLLSFGEKSGAIGYLIGQANHGLAHMFQMMNEARIGVGLIASCLAYRGYAESLIYARQRRQGRLPSMKNSQSTQIALIEHADVRRLLLAQKVIAEGGLALCLYASSLFEDLHSHSDAQERARARLLLDVMTPIVKSWSAKHGCSANDMAIQVLGGAGYTNEHILEQLYRDQRLNSIHEGTEAIHGLDLLGRKVLMEQGAAFDAFLDAVSRDIEQISAEAITRSTQDPLVNWSTLLADALARLNAVTALLRVAIGEDQDLALSNATVYLDAFGRLAVGWMWLKQAAIAQVRVGGATGDDTEYYLGKVQAARYYFSRELPVLSTQFSLLESMDRVPFDMKDGWF